MNLLQALRSEKSTNLSGGIYHQTQISLAYNSNRIEGSQLSEAQTRFIFETNTLLTEKGESSINVDDIVETVNHFACFDYLLDVAHEQLTEVHIKQLHLLLKTGTSQAKQSWFNVGAYKLKPNMVGGNETSQPQFVESDMRKLLSEYHLIKQHTFEDIIDFHFNFEKIHPFQDGNGRIGRLVLFKECLAHNITPFIILDEHKLFYYRGLQEYKETPGYLIGTCLAAQDKYTEQLNYFFSQY